MPIYEYECSSCGSVFEKMQRITEPTPETCEICGNGPVHKLISQSTFILKGSGWYVTDYGRGNAGPKKPESGSDSTSEPKPAKTEKKTESKPAKPSKD
jgi:putative FmdB family regulatory protein